MFAPQKLRNNCIIIGVTLTKIPPFIPSGLSAKQSSRQFSGQDRNFDGLAERFKRKVYGGLKGDIRLAVLQRDLQTHVFSQNDHKLFRILDAGGGQGQFSMSLAEAGHHVTLCDISSDMLALAADEVADKGLQDKVELHYESIQSLTQNVSLGLNGLRPFDLVLCHAVIEWVVDPELLLRNLSALVAPGGYLSLTFYNENSVILKNLLRGNFSRILEKDYVGFLGSLTPTNPLKPVQVDDWFKALPFEILSRSGIRCFHDYILDPKIQRQSPNELLAIELQLSQQEPFISLARYLHLLCKRVDDGVNSHAS
jgi:S-adenosylmethionine-dependent methyltransferase